MKLQVEMNLENTLINQETIHEILVSVVVPIYGVEKYLKQCLDSIIHQTYKNLEIILVDDGSIDGSAKICDEYASRDKRIIVIHKENGGRVSARKEGVKICNGEYTVYVDGDDWISVDYIETLINICSERRVDMVAYNFVREGTTKKESESFFPEGFYDRAELENVVFPRMLYARGFYEFGISPYPHKAIRTELLKKYQVKVPNDISMGEDAALIYPMLLDCQRIYICNSAKYHYRYNEEGITLKYYKNTANDSYRLNEYLRKELGSDYDLSRQLDYYHCLMALTNIVNTARGGLVQGFSVRYKDLSIYFNQSKFRDSIKRCHFKRTEMTSSKYVGVILLKMRMYRLAVIVYRLKCLVCDKHKAY